MPRIATPIRLATERIWLYGTACAVVASLPFILLPWFRDVAVRGDFAIFWSAGANVGTRALIDPARLNAWQAAHHLGMQPFLYLPAFAWIYAPLSRLAPLPGLVVEEIAMVATCALAAVAASRIYGFDIWFALVAVFAWAPTINSIEVGQNTGLALLLILGSIQGLVSRRSVVTGSAVGLLMYKPTVAIWMVLLLVARREWKALGVSACFASVWYVLSVAASGGEWLWPISYVHNLSGWFATDFAGSWFKAFTIPAILINAGLNQRVAIGVGYTVLVAGLPLVARVSLLEAASMMPLLGLITSPHSWPYEAALAMPAIFYAAVALSEPWRTRLVVTAYAAVAVGLVTRYGAWVLALVCIGGTFWWIAWALQRSRAPR